MKCKKVLLHRNHINEQKMSHVTSITCFIAFCARVRLLPVLRCRCFAHFVEFLPFWATFSGTQRHRRTPLQGSNFCLISPSKILSVAKITNFCSSTVLLLFVLQCTAFMSRSYVLLSTTVSDYASPTPSSLGNEADTLSNHLRPLSQ
jgi:hypothetical protein